MLKGLGYLVSTLSVIMLGVVSWNSASEKPVMLACLIVGMATSIVGMSLRWLSYRQEQREIQAAKETSEGGRDINPNRLAASTIRRNPA